MIAPPIGWHRISDADDLLAFSKQLKLTPKTFIEPRALFYMDPYTMKEPVPCKLVGYVDHIFVVLEIAGQLHTVHPEYLLDMQSSPEVREKRAQSNFSNPSYQDEFDLFAPPEVVEPPDWDIYAVIDIETTGLSRQTAEIIDLGAIKVENGIITAKFSQLIQPSEPIPLNITELTGITNIMLDGQPTICDALPAFLDFIGDIPLIGHNILQFDIPILNRCCKELSLRSIKNLCCDTLPLARRFLSLPNHRLETIAQALNIVPNQAHRALADCETTHACFERLSKMSSSPVKLGELALPHSDSSSKMTQSRKISQAELVRFKSRPKAKDIFPTVNQFDSAHPLYDVTCVITGELQQFSDHDIMQRIADCGGHNADNVTQKTNLLIIGSGSPQQKKSQKVKKAEEYIAKGLPIQIITEDQFLDILNGTAELPNTVQADSLTSGADRIFDEIRAALAAAQENYDLDKIQLKLRTPEKADSYHAIELFGQSCMNFKGMKTLYVEVSPKISALFAAESIILDDSRANAWARIPVQNLSFAEHPQLVVEIYEKYLMTNGFDCCSRYLECSEAGRCTHPNIMVAGQCTYRQRLRSGHIFYGSKRNV